MENPRSGFTVEQKLTALARRCRAPQFGPDGVCSSCCFAKHVTTSIASSRGDEDEGEVRRTHSMCSYREKLVTTLMEVFENSNPGLSREAVVTGDEAILMLTAFAQVPTEEKRALTSLIDSLFELHSGCPE